MGRVDTMKCQNCYKRKADKMVSAETDKGFKFLGLCNPCIDRLSEVKS